MGSLEHVFPGEAAFACLGIKEGNLVSGTFGYHYGFQYPVGAGAGGGGAPGPGTVGLPELAPSTEDPGMFVYEGGAWVYKSKLRIKGLVWTTARNANATNIWLRTTNGVPVNLSPLVMPYDATLVAISASGAALQSWDAEVYSGPIVRAGGVPADASKIAELVMTASNNESDNTLSVNLSEGDEVGVFMRGNLINRPVVNLAFIRRD